LHEVDAALPRPLGEVQRVGRRQRQRLRTKGDEGGEEPLGVPGADRDVAEPEPVEGF
jgi:hypothetical protein